MRQITCVITHGHARPVDRPLPTLVQDILNEHIQAAERRARTRTLGRVAPAIRPGHHDAPRRAGVGGRRRRANLV